RPQVVDGVGVHLPAKLAEQLVREEAAPPPDLPVDPPKGQGDALVAESEVPGADVLVDAVDQSAVEIEEEGRGHGLLARGAVSFIMRKMGRTQRLTRAIIAPGAIAHP